MEPSGTSRMAAPRPRAAIGSPKQQRSVHTRAQILQSAAVAFADKGFPQVTMLDVAQLAGVTKGAVYFHYANKEALAVAVVETFYKRLQELVAEADEDEGPLAELVGFLLRLCAAFRRDKLVQAGARLQIENALIGVPLPTPYQDVTEVVVSALSRAADRGDLPGRPPPEAFGRVLVAAVFGVQHISWVLADRADLADRMLEVIRALLPEATPHAERMAARLS
jgi:AcrR family transcriptional regulator